jgi:hypothetical protein
MRNLLVGISVCGLFYLAPATAESGGPLDYNFEFSIERSALEGLSLGSEPSEDRLVEEEYELEFSLEYQLSNDLYLFFTGSLIDETEAIETSGVEEAVTGLERKQMGLGYFFGDSVKSELNIGRMEFVSASEWWVWWDEELDAISLHSTYGDLETNLALAEEQTRESTDADFIDPEIEGIQRILLSLGWEFSAGHSLVLYYLDQADDSQSYRVGEFEDFDRVDEEDADLSWAGVSYLGEFDIEVAGEIEIELHAARVSGDETLYEFDDSAAGLSEVEEREQGKVSGSAHSFLVRWTPAALNDWTVVLGKATGSGDRNIDDSRDKSFRQSGLQGDSESFGELYQPELSNLVVDVIGFEWEISEGVELALLGYDYAQRELAEEMRDVSIENDLTGTSRALGQEVDLVLTIEARDGLEIILTAAEFYPGRAYGELSNETSNYINLELTYEF